MRPSGVCRIKKWNPKEKKRIRQRSNEIMEAEIQLKTGSERGGFAGDQLSYHCGISPEKEGRMVNYNYAKESKSSR